MLISHRFRISSGIKTRIDPKAGFDSSVSIADLTDDELRQIGSKWIEKLIANAKKIRSLR